MSRRWNVSRLYRLICFYFFLGVYVIVGLIADRHKSVKILRNDTTNWYRFLPSVCPILRSSSPFTYSLVHCKVTNQYFKPSFPYIESWQKWITIFIPAYRYTIGILHNKLCNIHQLSSSTACQTWRNGIQMMQHFLI